MESKLEWHPTTVGPMNWHQAKLYAASLGMGWRLPTKKELKMAYNAKTPGFKPDHYWSDEEYEPYTCNAWFVYFYDGYMENYYKDNNCYVRCVRGIQEGD